MTFFMTFYDFLSARAVEGKKIERTRLTLLQNFCKKAQWRAKKLRERRSNAARPPKKGGGGLPIASIRSRFGRDSVAIRSRFGRDCVAKTRLHLGISRRLRRFGRDSVAIRSRFGRDSVAIASIWRADTLPMPQATPCRHPADTLPMPQATPCRCLRRHPADAGQCRRQDTKKPDLLIRRSGCVRRYASRLLFVG